MVANRGLEASSFANTHIYFSAQRFGNSFVRRREPDWTIVASFQHSVSALRCKHRRRLPLGVSPRVSSGLAACDSNVTRCSGEQRTLSMKRAWPIQCSHCNRAAIWQGVSGHPTVVRVHARAWVYTLCAHLHTLAQISRERGGKISVRQQEDLHRKLTFRCRREGKKPKNYKGDASHPSMMNEWLALLKNNDFQILFFWKVKVI